MKKRIVSLLFAIITTLSLSLQAQTLTSTAPNGTFTASDIEYWVGEGENEIGIIFVYDNPNLTPDYFVLGYRWEGDEITLQDALLSISSMDSRFYMNGEGFLNDFAFDYNGDGDYEYSAYTNPNSYGYFCLKDECTDTPVGMADYYLIGDHWVSIEYKVDWNTWEVCFAESGEYTPISDPSQDDTPCLLPNNFHVDMITENSAVAYLGTLAGDYTLYLKADNENTFTSYTITSEVTYTMNNLQANTEYECYIIKNCGNENYSEESEHITFTTLSSSDDNCTISSFPYSEDFESYGITGGGNYPYPTCWTKITTGNIPNINTTKHTGNGGLYMQSVQQVVAVMPRIADNVELNTLSLSFWGKPKTSGRRIVVGVMTDKEDETTFDTIFAVSPTSTAWAEYTVDFSTYTGSAKYIAFMCNNSFYYIDDVVLTQNEIVNPVCEVPTFEVGNITENSADITINETNAEKYIVYLKSLEETEYTAYETENTSYTLTNLNSGTVYSIYVVADCGNENLSEQSQGQSFTTLVTVVDECAITSLPFTEDFDSYGGASGFNTYVYPTCWTLVKDGNFPNVNYSHYNGIASLYMNASSNSSIVSASMGRLSDDIDINSLKLTFFAKPNTTNPYCVVVVMTDPTDLNTYQIVQGFTLTENSWQEYEVNLSNYDGTGRYIAFWSINNTTTGNSYYVDAIKLDYVSVCERPQNLVATQNVQTGSSVDIAWEDDSENGQYYVYYKNSILTSYEDYVVVNGQTNTTIDNLDLNTTYNFIVKKVCSTDEQGEVVLSEASVEINYTTPCYAGSVVDFPYEESFDEGIGCWTQEQENGNISWTAATQYHFEYLNGEKCAKFDGGISSGNMTMLISPMFDFSNEISSATLTFSHIQEHYAGQDILTLYYRTAPTEDWVNIQTWENEIATWQTENIVLPNINGETQYQLGFEAVGDGGWGVAIDNLNISTTSSQTEPTCEVPTSFRVDADYVGDNTATLYWDTETGYNFVVYYRPVGSEEDFETVNVSGRLFLHLEDLMEGTTYECYMKTKCSETNLSEPTQTITFTTTTPTPNAPQITDENIIAWAKGVEVYTNAIYPVGHYYDAIGESNTTDYVSFATVKVTFNRPVVNGEGNDFVIFGNNNNNGHAWVEVSSNGEDFFRFANKTVSLPNGYGSVFDLEELDDNENLDKNNIRVIRLVDDGIGGYGLAGIGLYNAGEEYLVADFEDDNLLTAANTYEIVSQTNYTRTEENEEMELTYYYEDNVSAGLNFPGAGYYMEAWSWFMAMGFGPSNGVNSQATGNGVSSDYYVSSAEAGLEGVGSTYLQAYYDASSIGMLPHNEVYRNENRTFIPNGVYVSHSKSSYSHSGSTNDYTPGYHKVIATGYDENDQITGTASVYLTQTGTAYKDWKYLDLTALGEVKKVRFTLESNYANSYGLLIPTYFCLDNFTYTDGNEIETPCTPIALTENITVCYGQTATFKEQTLTEGENQITIAGQNGECDTIYTVTLTVLPQITATETMTVCYGEEEEAEFRGQTLTEGENQIIVAGQENDCDTLYTVTLVVREENIKTLDVAVNPEELPYILGTQSLETEGTYTEKFTDFNGCDSIVTINLTINSSINEVENEINVMLYPNPATNNTTLSIQGLSLNAIITISDVQGKTLAHYDLQQGQETLNINLSSFESGVYYVRIISDGISKTEKLIVK